MANSVLFCLWFAVLAPGLEAELREPYACADRGAESAGGALVSKLTDRHCVCPRNMVCLGEHCVTGHYHGGGYRGGLPDTPENHEVVSGFDPTKCSDCLCDEAKDPSALNIFEPNHGWVHPSHAPVNDLPAVDYGCPPGPCAAGDVVRVICRRPDCNFTLEMLSRYRNIRAGTIAAIGKTAVHLSWAESGDAEAATRGKTGELPLAHVFKGGCTCAELAAQPDDCMDVIVFSVFNSSRMNIMMAELAKLRSIVCIKPMVKVIGDCDGYTDDSAAPGSDGSACVRRAISRHNQWAAGEARRLRRPLLVLQDDFIIEQGVKRQLELVLDFAKKRPFEYDTINLGCYDSGNLFWNETKLFLKTSVNPHWQAIIYSPQNRLDPVYAHLFEIDPEDHDDMFFQDEYNGQKDGKSLAGTGSVFRSKVSRPLIVQRSEKHRYGEIGEVYRAPPTDEQETQMARRWYELGEGVA